MTLPYHKTQIKDKKTREKQQKTGVLMQIVLKTHYRRKKVREKVLWFQNKLCNFTPKISKQH